MKIILERLASRQFIGHTAGIALTLLVTLLYTSGNRLLDTVELKTYDMRLAATAKASPPGEIVIVAIDEKSLDAIGRWPWSRRTLSDLTDRLREHRARVMAFDVFFSEAENRQLLEQVQRLEKEAGFTPAASPYRAVRETLSTDNALAKSIAASGNAVLSMVFLFSEEDTRHLSAVDRQRTFEAIEPHAISIVRHRGDGRANPPLAEPRGVLANVEQIQAAAKSVGYINIAPDGDGSVRAATLVQRYQNHYFPSADVQAVRAYLEVGAPVLHTAPEGITGIGLGSRFTSTDEIGRAYINYLGPEKTIATLSAVDVLKGRVSRDALQDKMVLIGATAKGIGDVRVTPFGAAFPGAEIRATIMENLLHDRFILRPAWAFAVELLLILSLGFALAFALPKLHVRTSALAVATLIALYLVLSIYLFQQRVWINLVYPVLLWSLLFVSSTVLKYLTTESEKRYIKSAFQYYVPSKVVEEIANDVTKLRLGGEKRELTVLFSDIRGFTTVSETLAPEALVRLLNAYLTKMTGCVFKFDGMLDKYIGDAIMAVYGAPVPHPDHAARACRTALDMMRELGDLQKFWRESGQPSFDIGIGINTGPMVVGNMGSDARFDYTVIGDAVNLGSRIEALNKTYGTHVLVSEFTYRLVKAEFPNAREIDLTPVRGRAKPVAIFELIPEGIYPHLGWLDDFSHAYQLYRADKVKQAVPIFEKLYAAVGDPVSLHFTRRGKNPRRRVADKH